MDFVVCTHLHVDLVGWNTRWKDGRWVPTFPNAKYVIAGAEWEFWKYENESGKEDSGCIADSVVPVVEAGQALLVESDFKIGSICASSHGWATRRVTCVRLTRRPAAVFSGDLMPHGAGRGTAVVEPLLLRPVVRLTRRAFVGTTRIPAR